MRQGQNFPKRHGEPAILFAHAQSCTNPQLLPVRRCRADDASVRGAATSRYHVRRVCRRLPRGRSRVRAIHGNRGHHDNGGVARFRGQYDWRATRGGRASRRRDHVEGGSRRPRHRRTDRDGDASGFGPDAARSCGARGRAQAGHQHGGRVQADPPAGEIHHVPDEHDRHLHDDEAIPAPWDRRGNRKEDCRRQRRRRRCG